MKQPQPCVQALVDSVGGVRLDNEMVNWKLTMQLLSDKTSRTEGLGFMDPARMAADYELVKEFIGIATPYDVKAAYTNQYPRQVDQDGRGSRTARSTSVLR